MKAGIHGNGSLVGKEKQTIKGASFIVGCWFLGFLLVAIIVVRWAVLDGDPVKQSGSFASLNPIQQTPNIEPSSPTTAENEKASSVAPQPSSSSRSEETHIIQNFAGYLTEQYSSTTPYDVKVVGDDSEGPLRFDCSDDPHPEDVCFMLYKSYPGSREETNTLRTMGVRHLFFDAGLMKKSWEKAL